MSLIHKGQIIASNYITGDTLPIGSQIPFGSLTIPDNWLLCDGRAISRLDYSELFAVIGTSYGAGDGTTTFNLPNKKGRTSVGLDSSQTEFNTIGKTGGEKTHTLTIPEIPANLINTGSSGSSSDGYIARSGYTSDGNLNFGGSNQPHNNLQPYETDVWIIKAKQSSGVVATVVDNLDSTSSVDALSANQGKILNDNITTGWISADETWTYSSVDDPTGEITIEHASTNYSLGMRIRFNNGANVIYGIITKIRHLQPYTILTFLHEINPSTSTALHLMANSEITNNYYSMVKVPYGFPMNKSHWSIISVSTTIQKIASPVNGTWYNVGSFSITLPAGNWDVNYQLSIGGYGSNKTSVSFSSTLSTSSTSASDNRFVSMIYLQGASSTMNYAGSIYRKNNINLTQNTTYYLLTKTTENDILYLYNYGGLAETMVIAECAYL